MNEPTPTRRERQRMATMDEIVRTARQQLSEPGGLSLRSIAQEMGITAPALYRYVASVEHLTLTVAASIYDELVGVMEAAVQRYRAEDASVQILVAAIAYRQWSLRNRDEFALCFLTQIEDPEDPTATACAVAGQRFRNFFARLYFEVYQTRSIEIPTEEQLGELSETLKADLHDPFGAADLDGAGIMPVGAKWLFLQAWTRLFGTVALEAFGHVGQPLVESGELFRTMMRDCAHLVGIDPDEIEGFDAMVEAELRR